MKTIGRTAASVAVALGLLVPVSTGGLSSAATPDPFEAMGVERVSALPPAPDVTFRSLEGRAVHLRDLRGRVALLGFFTTW